MADYAICRQPPKVGAVCVNAHVRICAGGAGQPAFLPRSTLIALFGHGGRFYEQTLYLGSLFTILDLDPTSIPGSLQPPAAAGATGGRRWGNRTAPRALKRGIELSGVCFRYPESDREVLHDVSFTLRPGESAALVGRNGAGKTTAVKLLTRLYDPTAGRIYFDGHDLREYDLESLHRTFGVIFRTSCATL